MPFRKNLRDISANSNVAININNVVLKSALKPSRFNFIHINPGSLKPHLGEVSSLIDGVNIDIIAVSETWFTEKVNDNVVQIPGFRVIRHDRKKKRGGGVALYVKSSLKTRILLKSHHNAITEFLAIEIDSCSGGKLAFCVVYNPPANNQLKPLHKAITEICEKYDDCIFTGDFNINFLLSTQSVLKFSRFCCKITFPVL